MLRSGDAASIKQHRTLDKKTTDSSTATRINKADRDDVILFTRTEGGNYICLGTLAVAGYDLSVAPISIQWELLEYDKIKDEMEFKNILKENE